MEYDDFFNEAKKRNVKLQMEERTNSKLTLGLENEALFQLPLLAMVVLVLSKGRSKPKVSEIGQLVGECLERTVSGFKGSSQSIGWSANLRMRTIKAVSFLERRGYAAVDPLKNVISVTEQGRRLVLYATEGETPLSLALGIFERSFENIRAERGIMEEVE